MAGLNVSTKLISIVRYSDLKKKKNRFVVTLLTLGDVIVGNALASDVILIHHSK